MSSINKKNSDKQITPSDGETLLLKAFDSFKIASSAGVNVLLQKTRKMINAFFLGAQRGNSIILTLNFESAHHIKKFMKNLKQLEKCLMEDLKNLPGCQEYDLSHLYVEVEVNEDLYKECIGNTEESCESKY